ncbi:hypothetical protein B0O99DRAFT_648188 [Bisporella sp. PMI_857]|nr:hypothetical protein B0O99DRAFT_648188 [Bisporella sp. PMI_857]
MRFSTAVVALFVTLAASAPVSKRQVFSSTTYDDISISGGTAGNAEAEALAVFSALDTEDLANVTEEDLDFLNEVNQVANDAETEAFNVAIDNAADEAEKTALQNGKIKNKVLKLEATILKLQAQQAQGQDVEEKLATEQTKLNNNIALDEAAAGEESTFLSFDATIG